VIEHERPLKKERTTSTLLWRSYGCLPLLDQISRLPTMIHDVAFNDRERIGCLNERNILLT
jgi:hypothetical protein